MNEDVHQYHGEEIDVSYDVNRCIHAKECVRGLSDVFDPDERPWIDPDEASAEDVASVVMQCSTGALHFERTDEGEGKGEPVPDENTITVAPTAPLTATIELTTNRQAKTTVVAFSRDSSTVIRPRPGPITDRTMTVRSCRTMTGMAREIGATIIPSFVQQE
jgi:uncharacterized Fe-S cluster protein YjdI